MDTLQNVRSNSEYIAKATGVSSRIVPHTMRIDKFKFLKCNTQQKISLLSLPYIPNVDGQQRRLFQLRWT